MTTWCYARQEQPVRPPAFSSPPKVGRNKAVDCFTSTEIRSFPAGSLSSSTSSCRSSSSRSPARGRHRCRPRARAQLHRQRPPRKMEYPDRSSASYRSLTALIDRRVDLDRSIAPGDSRHHAALCVMASGGVRERGLHPRRGRPPLADGVRQSSRSAYTAQAFVFCDRGGAGRGAGGGGVPRDAGVRRSAVARRPGPVVAQGAAARARTPPTRTRWARSHNVELAQPKSRLLVTGHGAAARWQCCSRRSWRTTGEKAVMDRLAGVYAFGQPQVGDAMLAMFAGRTSTGQKRHFRFTYAGDPLPRLPGVGSPPISCTSGSASHFDVSLQPQGDHRPSLLETKKAFTEIPGEGKPVGGGGGARNEPGERGAGLAQARTWDTRGAYFREGWLLMLMRVLAVALMTCRSTGRTTTSTASRSPPAFPGRVTMPMRMHALDWYPSMVQKSLEDLDDKYSEYERAAGSSAGHGGDPAARRKAKMIDGYAVSLRNKEDARVASVLMFITSLFC
ncbi:hypothetical protein ZWY2020_025231 [Hordeum vulgare]|nr:hypothetical protein ZWY2020_025231 [Hordeum vulgare]